MYLLIAGLWYGNPLNVGFLAQLGNLFLHGLNLGHHFGVVFRMLGRFDDCHTNRSIPSSGVSSRIRPPVVLPCKLPRQQQFPLPAFPVQSNPRPYSPSLHPSFSSLLWFLINLRYFPKSARRNFFQMYYRWSLKFQYWKLKFLFKNLILG